MSINTRLSKGAAGSNNMTCSMLLSCRVAAFALQNFLTIWKVPMQCHDILARCNPSAPARPWESMTLLDLVSGFACLLTLLPGWIKGRKEASLSLYLVFVVWQGGPSHSSVFLKKCCGIAKNYMQLEDYHEVCTGDRGVRSREVYRAWIRVHKILRLLMSLYSVPNIKKNSTHPSLHQMSASRYRNYLYYLILNVSCLHIWPVVSNAMVSVCGLTAPCHQSREYLVSLSVHSPVLLTRNFLWATTFY